MKRQAVKVLIRTYHRSHLHGIVRTSRLLVDWDENLTLDPASYDRRKAKLAMAIDVLTGRSSITSRINCSMEAGIERFSA